MFSGMSQFHYMAALVERASVDRLTRAYTRRSGEEALDLLFRMSTRQRTPFTVMFLDLDAFKTVNDRHGHDAGDRVLAGLADRLRAALRGSDILIRWGGEEFLVILNNTEVRGARMVLDRITAAGPMSGPDGAPITASFGIAERLSDGCGDWPDLVDLADRRMYEAKRNGRNRAVLPDGDVVVFDAVRTACPA